MENEILEKIKNFAAQELKNAYGFCGVASGDDAAMLNSTDREGNDIKITIKVEPE